VRGFEELKDLDFGVVDQSMARQSFGQPPVYGLVFEDVDGDGVTDTGECALESSAFMHEAFLETDRNGDPRWFTFSPYVEKDGYWRVTTPASGGNCFRMSIKSVNFGPPVLESRLGLQRATGTSAIRVLIFNDADGDGKRDSQETLIDASSAQIWLDSDGCLFGRPVKEPTGKDGVVFSDLPAGGWWISGSVDGVRHDCQFDSTCDLHVASLTTGRDVKVELHDAETLSVEVGYKLSTLGAIVVSVVEDVNGDAAADPGEPPASGEVCYRPDGERHETCQSLSVNGRAIFRLPSGKGTIYVLGSPLLSTEVDIIEGKKRDIEIVAPQAVDGTTDDASTGITSCAAISC
jgi:hypothetical protein